MYSISIVKRIKKEEHEACSSAERRMEHSLERERFALLNVKLINILGISFSRPFLDQELERVGSLLSSLIGGSLMVLCQPCSLSLSLFFSHDM